MRYHALQCARQRGITRQQVKDVIRTGEISEEHPDDEPFPKCLLMAELEPQRPLYVSLVLRMYPCLTNVSTSSPSWLDPENGRPRMRKP